MRSEGTACPNCRDFSEYCENIIVCRSCGLGKTTSELASQEDQDYISGGGSDAKTVERREYFARLHGKYLKNLRRGRALDIGCGCGQFVEVLLDAGWDAYGLDAYRGLSASERILKETVDSADLGGSYDLISMVHSLEHMTRPHVVLSKLRGMLRRDGILLIVVPNFSGTWSGICGASWDMLNTRHHAFHYTSAALVNLLHGAGFDLREEHGYSGNAPSPWQQRLALREFYERGWGSLQPFRSLVFRANVLARPILNAYQDFRKRGAEIIALASMRTP